jgi:hypothetical protein
VTTREHAVVQRFEAWRDGWLMRRLFKSRFTQLGVEAEEATAHRAELQEQAELCRIDTEIDLSDATRAAFAVMCDRFDELSRSKAVWDIVSRQVINKIAQRSSASAVVEREAVKFRLGQCPLLKSEWKVPHLGNANGGDLFLYPAFVLYYVSNDSFALIDWGELKFNGQEYRFIEEGAVPEDARTVSATWSKVNKDGTPDRRFKDNRLLSVALYTRLEFASPTGLKEAYMVSNAQAGELFVASVHAFRATLPNLQ